jgi:serine/threonine protein kinase
MAEVWHGFDRRLGRQVAVKVLHPAGLADASLPVRFDREARTVADLSHPNIVALHDVKPANILLTDAGQVKVGDFGIAGVAAARGVS